MSRPIRLAAAGAAAFLLTGCAGTVALDPAPGAADPGCAEVVVRLPDTVDDQARRETNAQATGAWGDPASILLRCGVPEPGPSSDCVSVSGVDWIVDASKAPNYRFTTYGRTPTTEVIVDSTAASGTSVLVDLGQAIASVPGQKQCTSVTQRL